jgi:alanyl-tRNA synthetase
VTKDLTERVRAGDLMREFAGRLGGKGGGRPDMAQGGGSDVAALPDVLKAVPGWVEGALKS